MHQQTPANRSGLILGILIFLAIGTAIAGAIGLAAFGQYAVNTFISVDISTESGQDIFPREWHDDPTLKPRAAPIAASEEQRTKSLVERELKRYPPKLFFFGLDTVYCLKALYFYGEEYPSGYSGTAIYLTNDGYEDEWLENTFHQEVASMIFHYNGHLMPEHEWKRLLPKSFEYDETKDRKDLISDGTEREEKWLSQGFLNEYATLDQSLDFGFIGAGLMTGSYDFFDHLEKHPKLKRKAEFVAKVYETLGVKTPDF
jgi:hypothetical protein